MNIRRHFVQLLSTLAANPFPGNLLRGRIYQGPGKKICVPFLNCYGCPAALGACPLGTLQSLVAPPLARLSLYVVGIILLAGSIAGRFVCGWLCPFGFLQDLLGKLKRKKLAIPRQLTFLKFVLLPLVILLPILVLDQNGIGSPYFCRFICPAGTLTAGVPLLLAGTGFRSLLGPVFLGKLFFLVLILTGAVLTYRPFCRVFCPLGAFLGLFNRFSLFRLSTSSSCNDCGRCIKACPAELQLPRQQNSAECIRCLECVRTCPAKAMRFGPENRD